MTTVTVESHVSEVMDRIRQAALERMHIVVDEVRNTTLETLSGNRSGRTYKVPGSNRTYTASAPGEPPAQRLGELRQSISKSVEVKGSQITGKVGTDKPYGVCLEAGTHKMAARPWLRKSFEKSEDKVMSILRRKWFD